MPAAISRAPSAPWEQGGVHTFPLRVSPQRQMDSGNSWVLAPIPPSGLDEAACCTAKPPGPREAAAALSAAGTGRAEDGREASARQGLPTASSGPACPQALGSHRRGATDRLPLWASFSPNTNLETHRTLQCTPGHLHRRSHPALRARKELLVPPPYLSGLGQGRAGGWSTR